MSIPLAYGLVAQALIAAAAVRLAVDLILSRYAAALIQGDSIRPHGIAAFFVREQRVGDLPRGVAWAAMAGPVVLLAPLGGCTVAEHMRGIWGDPSVVTCALLAIFIARPGRLPARPSRPMCIGITVLVTLPLYAPIFGLALPLPDLYALGWSAHALLLVIAVAGAMAWIGQRWCATWATIVAIALMAYALRAMESSNLIDYLADPGLLLTIAAMSAMPTARPDART
ncbi:MAG: hypothetical protein FGM37_10055 [Phycisphaerales bacterium]|nr:hypothetical protein [Phycisphaerales bacterium]